MKQRAPQRRFGRVAAVTAVVAAIALVVTGAVIAQGYDTQKSEAVESSVWVTKASGQYARVDTDLKQLSTVRDAEDPSGVVQHGSQGIVFTQGFRQAWDVDPADPKALVEGSSAAAASTSSSGSSGGSTGASTPSGTRQVLSNGDWAAYLTDAGTVYVQQLSAQGSAGKPVPIDPLQQEQTSKGAEGYVATAVAVGADGTVALYSAKERAVRVYDAARGTWTGDAAKLASPPPASAKVALALAGGTWVLAAPAQSKAWIAGRDAAVDVRLGSDAIAGSTSDDGTAYFADGSGLVSVQVRSGQSGRTLDASGTPAAPTEVAGTVYGAWLSTTAGRLWSSRDGAKALDVPQGTLEDARSLAPQILSNGQRAVLDETESGTLWTIPDGTLIPPSQWNADDEKKTQETETTTQVEEVTQEMPPVAQPSSFGVRAGATAILPVLLNAHSPVKRAVLTIVPDSLGGGLSDPGFGDLSLTADDQQLAVHVRAQSGTATFSYVVTDGLMQSQPATVTLHVVADADNGAPAWCGIENCMQTWPTVSLAPGGTVSVPVLSAWVDPDGDPIALADARKTDAAAPIRVVATADGHVAVRHTDPNAGAGTYAVTVTVVDARGAQTTKELVVSVAADPALTTVPAAVVTGVGEPRTEAIADHVEGGSGSYRLTDAVITTGDKDNATVTPNGAAGTIQLTAKAAGEYFVGYTVQDAQTKAEQTGVLRFSVVAGGRALTIPPLVAFARAQEDTTLDVLPAVQNTSGRVLAVQSVTADDDRLSASVVDNAQVRVSGTTADGRPGRIGTATVTIGDGAGQTVQGEITVFLVDPATGIGPIARPDAVTVRAGTQVDIPVTANDIAPRGERLVLASQIEGSGASGELVFAAGDTVRYLAPTKAGVYTVHYSDYVESDPSRLDSTEITVTVVADGANRAPEPSTLTARVRAGGTVTLAIPSAGQDPDGDATVLSSLSQPKAGSGAATIGADGRSVVYTAPGGGVSGGQVSFGYTLRDRAGATGDGVIRIAVLGSADADVAPITYSDAVRTVKGSNTPLTVQPLLNDRDPAGGTLSLVSVVPNAPELPGSSEYNRLKGLIASGTDLKSGTVRLLPGSVEGVQSYIYTVKSSATSSTAQGLIVVTVTAEAATDVPVVTDTVVGTRDRGELATGIDVVAGKTVWSSGSISDLTLAVWGPAASSYTVKGHRISGPVPRDGALVPFSLTGTDQTGRKSVGYGFLRIPAFDDMRLQLAGGLPAYKVGEEQSVSIPLKEAVDLASGDALQVRDDSTFAVQRANARCTPAGGSTASYAAGREAPWTDTCTVQVRLAGQSTWTALPVPVVIQPKSPQAQLNSVSRTVAPGASQTIDLYADLTSWEGGRVGDQGALDYSIVYSGTNFAVTQSGRTLTATARADAHPGARETVTVKVTSFGGLTANVTLVVGAAPPDAPRAATFTQSCSVSSGPSCAVTVIGVAGEYDPFQGKQGSGLKLVGLGQTSCAVAAISATGTTAITATWPGGPKPAGGSCIVPYTVADAQGRTGGGTLTLDVQGYPAQPSSVTTTGFTGSSVTLLVTLGEAALAHPGLRGVAIYENGQQVPSSCAAGAAGTYSCTVGGLVNGQRHTFTARAVNAVGESLDTTPVLTWAYQPPVISGGSSSTVYDPARTNATQGVISLAIQSSDDTSGFQISIDGNPVAQIPRSGATTTWTGTASPGSRNVSVTPVSQFQPPLGSGNTGSVWAQSVQVSGSPIVTSNGSLVASSNTALQLKDVGVDANHSAKGVSVLYAVWREGSPQPSCSMDGNGIPVMPGGQASNNFGGLQEYTKYFGQACAANGFGAVSTGVQQAYTFTVSPGGQGVTYTVGVDPSRTITSGAFTSGYEFLNVTAPNVPQRNLFGVFYRINGDLTSTFSLSRDVDPGHITYSYCFLSSTSACGAEADVTSTTIPTTVTVNVPTDCTAAPTKDDIVFSGAVKSANAYTITITNDTATLTVSYKITFTGAYAALGERTLTRCGVAAPTNPNPDPGTGGGGGSGGGAGG
ncbi:Ig-like domain-containing protein [Leifsonia naganoensis]|uniref:Fibronectin type III domain-containing protein n=1 Tax=Leifsonia naganoensis TaxID=150025 RepID=A0A853DI97_9MICO|nr:hypothetical protein [Leifsonia naganoensis]